MNNLNFISPEIFISLSIMFLLILGVFKKNGSSFNSQSFNRAFTNYCNFNIK